MASRPRRHRRHNAAVAPAAAVLLVAARTERSHAHRMGQASLAALAARAVDEAWHNLFDRHDLRGSSRRLSVALEAIVVHYGRAGASAALTHFRNERRAQLVPGSAPRLSPVSPPSSGEIEAVVDAALEPLYGPATETTTEAERKAEEALASEIEQMVLNQSRETIINAVQVDGEARAWARVTEPGACSFCRLLATRGAVYKTEGSGNFRAHVKRANGSGGTCRCHVEPAFGPYEMTAQARQDLADYQRLAEEFGHSGRDLLIAWRQHVEGRPVTGPLVKPYTRSK